MIEVQNKNLGTHIRTFRQNIPKDWAYQVQMYAIAYNSQPLAALNVLLHQIVDHTRSRIPLTFDLNSSRKK